jgi:hypothetical protein
MDHDDVVFEVDQHREMAVGRVERWAVVEDGA